MHRFAIFLLFLATACGGTLSDDQRKKLRENMAAGEIKRVTDAELTEATFKYGRQITDILEAKDKSFSNERLIDSLEAAFNVQIVSLEPGDSTLHAIEQLIIEAYIGGSETSEVADHVQKIGSDSLLYTRPVLRDRPDGSVEFIRAIGLRMPTKSVVLSIKD